jgi:DNA polymerase alpha subunit B
MLPNPCVALLDGQLQLAAVSADVMKALSGAECSRCAPGEDRLARLAGQLLGQRSLYPLYPPAPGLSLDTARGAQLELGTAPHLLLLASDLAPFARVLPAACGEGAQADRDTVAVNPGRAARGTCAQVHVLPEEAGSAFSSQVRVDLVKL